MDEILTNAELAILAAADADRDIGDKWVQWPRRCCPACGGERLKTTSSRATGDGARIRRIRCRTCEHAFAAVIE